LYKSGLEGDSFMASQLRKGDVAPAATVIDMDDEHVALDSLWANGPTFLTFLRHFG
jgi:hypothetical protein